MKNKSPLMDRTSDLYKKIIVILIFWTFLIVCLVTWVIYDHKNTVELQSKINAVTILNKDLSLRQWTSLHGGVYAPISKHNPPNQYLKDISERDISTPSGKQLTLINPAYLLRQITTKYNETYGVGGHLTSLKLVNPINKPDSWERKALESFDHGVPEVSEIVKNSEGTFFRLIQPMIVKKSCLKCHGYLGYKEGDVRGGISVSIPLEPFIKSQKKIIKNELVVIMIIYFCSIIIIILLSKRILNYEKERFRAQKELQDYHLNLEQKVTKRTHEIQTSNNKLLASQNELNQLIDRSLDPIIFSDETGNITRTNNAFLEMMNCELTDVTGKKIYDFSIYEEGTYDSTIGQKIQIDSEFIKDNVENSVQLLDKGHVGNWETYFLNMKKQLVPIVQNVAILKNNQDEITGSFCIIHDITKQRIRINEINQTKDQLDRIVEGSVDGIIVSDNVGTIIKLNKAALEILGRTEAEVVGKMLMEFAPRQTGVYDTVCDTKVNITQDYFDASVEMIEELFEKGKIINHRSYLVKKSGRLIPTEEHISLLLNDNGEIIESVGILHDITSRVKDDESLNRMSKIIDQAFESIIITDNEGVFQFVNPAFEKLTGYSSKDVSGLTPRILKSGRQDPLFYKDLWETIKSGKPWEGNFYNKKKDGSIYQEKGTIFPIFDVTNRITHFVKIIRDITREVELESKIQQSQKLESMGQLAGGIAHEINTPVQYVGNNISFLNDVCSEMSRLLNKYETAFKTLKEKSIMLEMIEDIEQFKKDVDIQFLGEEFPKAVIQAREGTKRIAKIVAAMKEFAKPSSKEKTLHNINDTIETTVTLTQNMWCDVAEVKMEFDPGLPLISCISEDLNEVMLVMILNAVDAITAAVNNGLEGLGRIIISTCSEDEWVEIRIRDNGTGIPVESRSKIFDPFYTTKDVGKGMGQSLAIVYSTIADKHGGSITFKTEVGKGTEFVIRLPADTKD